MLGGELVTFVDGIFIACREELFFGVLNYPFPYTYLLRHLSRLKFCQKRWELFFAAFAAKLSKHLVLVNLFKKWAESGLFFIYFRSFQTHITIFATNKCEKMAIQYTGPGFELTTLERESPPITTRPGLLPSFS